METLKAQLDEAKNNDNWVETDRLQKTYHIGLPVAGYSHQHLDSVCHL